MPLKTNGEKPNDFQLKIQMGYLPGGLVSKNPPASAGDRCSTPGLGTKPMHHNYGAHRLQLLKPSYPRARDLQTREATAMRSACPATREEPPLAVTRESPHTAKIYCSQN